MEKYSNCGLILRLQRIRERVILKNRDAMNQLAFEFQAKNMSKKSKAYSYHTANYKKKEALLIANFNEKMERINAEIHKLITKINENNES